MATSTVTSKGQVTLPKEIRDHLRVEPGDRIEFTVREGGEVVVVRKRPRLDDLYGCLHDPGGRRVEIEEMDAAIEAEHGQS